MEYPHSEVGSEYPLSPKMKNVRDFEFHVTGIPPPMKNVRDFEFHVTGTPPPPPNSNLGKSWHFKTFQF